MTYRSMRNRELSFGAFLVIAPVLDALASSAMPGLMHLITAMSGIALLAAALSSGKPRAGYGRYDPS